MNTAGPTELIELWLGSDAIGRLEEGWFSVDAIRLHRRDDGTYELRVLAHIGDLATSGVKGVVDHGPVLA